jgi:transposase InsO family protein
MVEQVIRNLHEGFGTAHQAVKATTSKVVRRFYWPGLKRDVRLYVACCPVCEEYLHSSRTPKAELHPMEVGGPGDCLALDIVGGGESLPLTARGSKYILSIVDCFTRYSLAIPLIDQCSESVINAVIGNYITVYGAPRRILTDQGKCFESALFSSLCKFFRISKIRTSGYRPQSNGICERFNQTLKRSLCKLLPKSLLNS